MAITLGAVVGPGLLIVLDRIREFSLSPRSSGLSWTVVSDGTCPGYGFLHKSHKELYNHMVHLITWTKYKRDGTVEFLLDQETRQYFIEANPQY